MCVTCMAGREAGQLLGVAGAQVEGGEAQPVPELRLEGGGADTGTLAQSGVDISWQNQLEASILMICLF